jgi:hypothetical protein
VFNFIEYAVFAKDADWVVESVKEPYESNACAGLWSISTETGVTILVLSVVRDFWPYKVVYA